MIFGKRRLLAAFLEKDNLKLLSFEIAGRSVTRVFGGQLSFGADVVREAFIADPIKFSGQIKMALSQKPEAANVSEAVLFIPPEKTFIKAIPNNDAIESFVRTLPYFKEELVITEGERAKGDVDGAMLNHLAFEKKMIEDLERPFLDSGKKILAALSSVKVLADAFAQPGKYFLLVSFDKETVVVVMQDRVILDMASFAKDVWTGRMNEFRLGKNFSDVKEAFSLGVFDGGALDRVRNEQQLNVKELASTDIYDLVVSASQNSNFKTKIANLSLPVGGQISNVGSENRIGLPNLDFSGIKDRLPNQKLLFLVGAAIVGFVLVLVVAKNLTALKGLGNSESRQDQVKNESIVKSNKKKTPPPAPVAIPKPADFKVRVLNGTTVTGEAGRAGEAISALGFDVVETKNATASGFMATRLRVVPDVPQEIVDQIKTALLVTYESVSLESLVDDVVKVEIIIGKKKG
jgi:hypothetical protein